MNSKLSHDRITADSIGEFRHNLNDYADDAVNYYDQFDNDRVDFIFDPPCGNGIDEDCSGADLACLSCNEGLILSRCICEGNIHDNGYCCSGKWQRQPQIRCLTAL